MTTRRISRKEIRRAIRPSARIEAAPAGISPVLKASWKFARNTARRFSRELIKERVDEFLKKLTKRFV